MATRKPQPKTITILCKFCHHTTSFPEDRPEDYCFRCGASLLNQQLAASQKALF